jgi:hypothetical protein
MKKNKMMRIASGLLVLTLLTACIISGTFAKYVTSATASDTARVAKWGVQVQVSGTLFGEKYDAVGEDDKGNTISVGDTGITVMSTDKKIVAPGTKNDKGITFSLEGKPEVSGTVTTTITTQNIYLAAGTYGVMVPVETGTVTAENFEDFTDPLYTKNGNGYVVADAGDKDTQYYTLQNKVKLDEAYYPVEYSLAGKTETSGTGTGSDSLDTVVKALEGKLSDASEETEATADGAVGDENDEATEGVPKNADGTTTYTFTKDFIPNKDLSEWSITDETLTWEWAYEGNDDADTILGDLIAGLTKNSGGTAEVVKIKDEPSAADESKDGEDSSQAIVATALTVNTTTNNVYDGDSLVGCVNTTFNITITATQKD